jgi:hypothetical protein
MTTCTREKINGFQSLSEFDRFVDWMTAQTKAGTAEEVAIQTPSIGATTFREKWFRHVSSGDTWRLVWPDAPFKGVFEGVDRPA